MAAKNSKFASDCLSDHPSAQAEVQDWVDRETVDGTFKDERLGRRFKTLLADIGGAIGASLLFACQDWANTKAAYRFLSNERVDEADILSGHFAATAKRFNALDGMILVLQDTTEFSDRRRSVTIAMGFGSTVESLRQGRFQTGRKRGQIRRSGLERQMPSPC